jgi:hypothetical protein
VWLWQFEHAVLPRRLLLHHCDSNVTACGVGAGLGSEMVVRGQRRRNTHTCLIRER